MSEKTQWLNSKTPNEVINVVFDFAALVTAIDTIDSITIAVQSGVDANVGTMLSGSGSILGTRVIQLVRNGVDGVDYLIVVNITRGSEKFSLAGSLPVRAYK